MHIILVDWRIRKGQEKLFVGFWKSDLHIENRSHMIGEYLSEVNKPGDFLWIDWNMLSDSNEQLCTRYINVGIWQHASAFEQEVGSYFRPVEGRMPFEFELRRRALLTPKAWRTGLASLPKGDFLSDN